MAIKWTQKRALDLSVPPFSMKFQDESISDTPEGSKRLEKLVQDRFLTHVGPQIFQDSGMISHILCVSAYKKLYFEAPGGLGGLKLDEIEAANPFLTLPTAKNGLEWPIISQKIPQYSHRFP